MTGALAADSAPVGELIAHTFFPLSLATADGARMAETELVSGSYFHALRVSPFLGRFFGDAADRAGVPAVAVLSYRLWRDRFGAGPGVIGRTVRERPAGRCRGGGASRIHRSDDSSWPPILWMPAALYPELAGTADAGAVPMFGVIVASPSGLTPTAAAARLGAIAARLPVWHGNGTPPAVVVTPARGFGVPPKIRERCSACRGSCSSSWDC